MKKDYQTKAASAATAEFVMPDRVSVAMAELTENVKEGLLALAVGAGLQVMHVLMAENATGVCGPKGRHDPERTAVRSRRRRGRRRARRQPPVRGRHRDGTGRMMAADLSALDLVGLMVDAVPS